MHCIHDITCTIYDISSSVYITFTICVILHNDYMTSHTLYLGHIHFIWHHTQYYDNTTIVVLLHHCVTSQPFMSDITPIVSLSSHPMYQFYQPSVSMTLEPLYVWHHMHFIWHHILYLWYHTSLWYQNHYISHLTHYNWHCICLITPTVLMTSHQVCRTSTVYVRHHMHYKRITSTLYDIIHHYLWHHRHYHDITPTVYDIISTVSVSSHPLY